RKTATHIENIYGKTPILPLEHFEKDGIKIKLFGKFENVQSMYTFKVRGAEWFTYNLVEEYSNKTGRFRNKKLKETPVLITASAGNHAQGVALAANRYGLKSVVFMPKSTPNAKRRRVEELGAKIVLVDGFFDDALDEAKKYKKEQENAVFVPPYEDPQIMEGQATIGVEILSQLCSYGDYRKLADFDWLDWETPDVILCGLGGGGLSSGIGSVIKEYNEKSGKNIKVIGVQSDAADSMYQTIKNNTLQESTAMDAITLADGIAVKKASERMSHTVKKYVNQIVLVSEESIKKSIAYIHQHPDIHGTVYGTTERETPSAPQRKLPGDEPEVYRKRELNRVEGAGAAPYAAVVFGDNHNEINWKEIAGDKKEINVVCVLTGANISSSKYKEFGQYVKRPPVINEKYFSKLLRVFRQHVFTSTT
ncbi:MAG: pyridoxal-phosphate dependent enzyme, partial [Candidatus Aenigmarchaeota archaeon]|nr:pyridoxal-phosphate dependent enzyme [Candidatus Aenigmarchaeota archaeon]